MKPAAERVAERAHDGMHLGRLAHDEHVDRKSDNAHGLRQVARGEDAVQRGAEEGHALDRPLLYAPYACVGRNHVGKGSRGGEHRYGEARKRADARQIVSCGEHGDDRAALHGVERC